MGRFSHIHRSFRWAEGGRPNAAVLHTYVNIKSGRILRQIIEAVAGDTEYHWREPPAHSSARLGDEGVHSAVRKIVYPWLGKIKSIKPDLPLPVIEFIRKLFHK